ncbi:hypothetical protein E3Q08_00068 [Wallemia mellicola]|uniref:Septin-type G domain-containing protein n=1 Tax=Wallemia mellicola TaxID=1708541 RepID=A0AB38N0A3_9BASI|nr:hypothetical protein E3Q09_01039 [Wallemia mellicola]TIC47181.1 hypothetical protein E3Q08_00068 [Wallemia mellicola]TIC56839.1 hypothetical protein E3Q04_00827 [Wallemia mellicola]TIC71295.1 hypothetical protein E3Q02_00102 [Wallemia mellicola]
MNNIPESISILDNILSTASSVNYRRKSFPDMLTLEALTAFVTESIQHMDSDTLLNLLLRENLIKKSRLDFVLSTPVVRRPFGYSEHIKPLCRVLYSLPLKHAAEHVKSNDAADTIMAIANGRQSYCTSAQSIYELLLSRSLSVSEDQAKILMTNLIRKNETTAAKTVYYTLPTPSEEVTRVAHKAFARDGQTSELNRLDKVSITTRIFAFAENGDLHGALEMYSTLDEPSDRDKQAVLTAYIRNDDLEGALSWVRKTPGMNRRRVYARLLSLFVRRIDVDSAMALDTAMREEGIALTEDHFTQLIKLYAKRRDIEMAERVVRQMIKEGVKPSTETWSALMNAATNANDWRKVVRIYQHISKKYVINTKIVNTLLKAYVMLGSPFEDVLSVIKAMLGMGIRADEVTFALAMQSACDMGRLDTAVYFLEECERWYKNRLIDKPNVVHYTLLIAAMLRVGHMSDAKFWYGKMKEEGVQPDSVTYGVIIASYLSRGGDDNVKIAKLTLSNLLGQDILDARANWMEKSKSKQQTLSNVLKPFIQNYGKRFTPQLAQETFEYMTEVGISVNIENLTMLMDGYRRVGNHAVVNDIWANMIRIASSTKLAKNGLCLPLSIYIDSLTAQGRLDDLHEAFKIVRENGYGFDAHNWNHLAVGLNRLGDYYLAFSVVERILTVCESKSRRGTYTATYDDEPLDLIEEPTTNETIETEDIPQPNRASIRRSNIAAQAIPPTAPLNVNKEAQQVSNVVRKKLSGFVGFANLPNQVHRKSVRKGFSFTCMVVGESGLGKSTLVNTLFETSLYQPKTLPELGSESASTVGIENISADIEENGVRLKLTVVDTPGFGDFVNNDSSWDPIVTSIESRFDQFLEQENRVNRAKLNDNRVNACIYFIQPTGHSLRQVDIEFMRRLHTKVNLIPVIAKSDTLSEEEVESFKRRILSDIEHHNIQIFKSPVYEQEDEETIQENQEIESKIPFAIVGSTQTIQTPDGRNVRGRSYPWGVVEVDNEEHCDFVKLRQMIIRTHMEELKESTNVLYENYRSEKLLAMGVQQDASVFKEVNPTAKAVEEKALHDAKLSKMEAEMKLVFQQKVQEKEAKLRQSEEELYARHREMKESLEKQRQELEDKRRRLESGRPLTPERGATQSTQKKSRGFLRS